MRIAAWVTAAVFCTVAGSAFASPGKKAAPALPRADFHAVCPFTVAAPSVLAVLDAKRWNTVLGAARTVPPPYEGNATNFRRESVIVVVLPHTSTPITEAALNPKRPERYDQKTGTLTLWYDVRLRPPGQGEVTTQVVGEPCLVTWVTARTDLQQIVARTSDGRYIAGTRLAEKPKKKADSPK